MTTRYERLDVVTSAAWLADDLAHNTAVPVRHTLGLDAPDPDDRAAFWCSGAWAARVHATGIPHPFLSPGKAFLPGLPASFLGRKVRSGILGDLLGHDWHGPLFVKLAEHKSQAFTAKVHTGRASLADHTEAAFAGRPAADVRTLTTVVSQPASFTAEFRCFITEGHVTAASHYLTRQDGAETTWQAHGPKDGPDTTDAARFAQDVCDALGVDQPPGYTLDVGRLDTGAWAVVEANAAWSSNPYHADPDGAVAAILASQRPCPRWAWRPDALFASAARPLPTPVGASR